MIQDLGAWLLSQYGQEVLRPDPNLSRMRLALGDLLPKLNQKKIITVAGTNGKGETILRLSELLGERSHVVWTSPHIERVTERFKSESGEINSTELSELVHNCDKNLRSRGIKLSYYEFLFYVFCQWTSVQDPEFILLEVGLGGRLDAVNVFDAELLLLPSISRDHQEYLGNRYDGILKEKIALLRKGATLISFLKLKYLQGRASDYAQSIGAEHVELETLVSSQNLHFSERNYLLAHAAYSLLIEGEISLSQEMLRRDLRNLSPLSNRGELIEKGGRFILFGSHNTDGMRKLIQLLHSDNYNFPSPPFTSVYVAFSKRDERDLRVLLRMLKKAGLGEIRVTSFPHPKAMDARVMKNLCDQEGLNFVQNIEENLQHHTAGETGLVTGSYYFLGHVKSLLCGR